MLHVNILERLTCRYCLKRFTFANPDVLFDPIITAFQPVPKQEVCNSCFKTQVEEWPEMRAQYHSHLRAMTTFNLKSQLLAG